MFAKLRAVSPKSRKARIKKSPKAAEVATFMRGGTARLSYSSGRQALTATIHPKYCPSPDLLKPFKLSECGSWSQRFLAGLPAIRARAKDHNKPEGEIEFRIARHHVNAPLAWCDQRHPDYIGKRAAGA
jgi:hypothetical protein